MERPRAAASKDEAAVVEQLAEQVAEIDTPSVKKLREDEAAIRADVFAEQLEARADQERGKLSEGVVQLVGNVGPAIASGAAAGLAADALKKVARQTVRSLMRFEGDRFCACGIARQAIEAEFGYRPVRVPVEESDMGDGSWSFVFQEHGQTYTAVVKLPALWLAKPTTQTSKRTSTGERK